MSRPVAQRCCVCGGAFLGSDCITHPIVCHDCERSPEKRGAVLEVRSSYERLLERLARPVESDPIPDWENDGGALVLKVR